MKGIHKYSLIAFILMITVLTSSKISFSTNVDAKSMEKYQFFQPVIDKLLLAKVDTTFIYKLLQDYRTKFNEKYIKINVTGFLKKNDYSSNYNSISVDKSSEFIQQHLNSFLNAESKYNVPKEVIASILWIETKFGTFLGNHHVASVYLSTAMCNQPMFIQFNKNELRKNFEGDTSELPELDKKIEERAEKKSKWAIEQLIALEQLDKTSPIPAVELVGSWAGAFGISQFLPSSYMSWACDGNNDGRINLYDIDDAIFSVANYLKINGWESTPESHRKAVFHYNNLNDYVDAVLKLSEKLQKN